jgi:DNA-directed RNA polymerase alpha subunit
MEHLENRELADEFFRRAKEIGFAILEIRLHHVAQMYRKFGYDEGYLELKASAQRIAEQMQDVRNKLVAMALQCSPDRDILGKSITELQLPTRGRMLETQLGIRVVGELTSFTASELFLAIRNFGEVTLTALQRKLAEIGLKLKDEKEVRGM